VEVAVEGTEDEGDLVLCRDVVEGFEFFGVVVGAKGAVDGDGVEDLEEGCPGGGGPAVGGAEDVCWGCLGVLAVELARCVWWEGEENCENVDLRLGIRRKCRGSWERR